MIRSLCYNLVDYGNGILILWMEAIRQLETIGVSMRYTANNIKKWNYNMINHLPTGAGFLRSTVVLW